MTGSLCSTGLFHHARQTPSLGYFHLLNCAYIITLNTMAGNIYPYEYFLGLLIDAHQRFGSPDMTNTFTVPFPSDWLTPAGIIKDRVLVALEMLRSESFLNYFKIESFGTVTKKDNREDFHAYLDLEYNGKRFNEFLYEREYYKEESVKPKIYAKYMERDKSGQKIQLIARVLVGKQIKEYVIGKQGSETAKFFMFIYDNIYKQMNMPSDAKKILMAVTPPNKNIPTYASADKVLRGKLSNLNKEIKGKGFPYHFSIHKSGIDIFFSINSLGQKSKKFRAKIS
jgi:hypothetical protein